MFTLPEYVSNTLQHIGLMIAIISAIIHLIFASAVARDAGHLVKQHRTTYLVSGVTWAFATLMGGVFVAAIYWLMHYSTLARGGIWHDTQRSVHKDSR